VRVDGERWDSEKKFESPHQGQEASTIGAVNKGELYLGEGQTVLLQVGKRRFLRVRAA
jgi:hypothetical protein